MIVKYIMYFSVLLILCLSCSTPTGGDDPDYSNIDSLFISKDTTIVSFKEEYIHICNPTTVLLPVNSYLFYDSNYTAVSFFSIYQVNDSKSYITTVYNNGNWNPLTYINDTISFSAFEGYYKINQSFIMADINISILFKPIDTIDSDPEPNGSFANAVKINFDQYYYGYLGILKDALDCYSFSSDSGYKYSLIISNHDYTNHTQPLKIEIANSSGKQNDYFYNDNPNDTLKINAISKTTYICLRSDLNTGISYKFLLLDQ
jgi:hypothetical protein